MKEVATTLEAADIAAILKALPHRYPFLMVDRIINMDGDESAADQLLVFCDWQDDDYRLYHPGDHDEVADRAYSQSAGRLYSGEALRRVPHTMLRRKGVGERIYGDRGEFSSFDVLLRKRRPMAEWPGRSIRQLSRIGELTWNSW